MKKKLIKITSTAVPLDRENIDTDQILPARYLRAITRDSFAANLFRDLRFDHAGKPIPNFVMNDPRFSGEILIAGHNFGGGSSREHAAWALSDYGFTVVVSSFFGDIFKNNALGNSLLPVEVSEDFLRSLFVIIENEPETVIEIDIPRQTITAPSRSISEQFNLEPYRKQCLMNGYDDIDYLVSMKTKIEAYEQRRSHHE